MSAVGAVIILITLVLRKFAANRLPKNTFLILWGIVMLKLLIPVSFSSQLSVYNALPETPSHFMIISNSSEFAEYNSENYTPVSSPSYSDEGTSSDYTDEFISPEPVKTQISVYDVITAIRIVGMSAFFTIFIISYITGIRKFNQSLPLDDDFVCEYINENFLSKFRSVNVRISDQIKNPLTYGIFKPVILLPKDTDFTDRENLMYIITHEMVHIRRFDVLYKIILTFSVCVHWFNPLVWVMYYVANRDIELACDEAVVRKLGIEHGSSYAMTLILMEEKKKRRTLFNPAYSGFSRYAIQERVKSIMKIKKISVISIILAVVVILSVTVVFASSSTSSPLPKSYVCGTQIDGDEPAVIVMHPMLVFPNDFTINDETVYVNSYDELVSVLKSEPYPKNIVISSDMTIEEPKFKFPDLPELDGSDTYEGIAFVGEEVDPVYIPYGVTLTVAPDVTLYVDSNNFMFSGDLINNGNIVVSERIGFYFDPTKMGNISLSSPIAQISRYGVFSTGTDLEKYLSEDSKYTEINIVSTENTLVISKDLLIPEGKTLNLNGSVTLHLKKNATIENRGAINTCGKYGKTHIIEGTITGNSLKDITEGLELYRLQ